MLGNVCARHGRSRVGALLLRRFQSTTPSTTNRRSPLLVNCHDTHQQHYSFRQFASTSEGNGDGNEEEEEWMPPDDSPLVTNKFDLHTSSNMSMASSVDINEDEIEVIDLR